MAALDNRIRQIGTSLGINFRFGGRIGSTTRAHRLIDLCQKKKAEKGLKNVMREENIQNTLVNLLSRAYHEDEKDVTDKAVLLEIAAEAGLDRIDVEECLESDATAVNDEAKQNREKLTSAGVPVFLIQDKYRVDGSRDLEDFIETFIKVKEEANKAGV